MTEVPRPWLGQMLGLDMKRLGEHALVSVQQVSTLQKKIYTEVFAEQESHSENQLTTLADANAEMRICAAKARQGCHEESRRLLLSADLDCSRRQCWLVSCAWPGLRLVLQSAHSCPLTHWQIALHAPSRAMELIDCMNQAPCRGEVQGGGSSGATFVAGTRLFLV